MVKQILASLIIYILVFLPNAYSSTSTINLEHDAEVLITQIYKKIDQEIDMASRLEVVSSAFLEKEYLAGALGEGRKARYDQSPLYRVDKFDCETLVDLVLAIAFSKNLEEFKQYIRKIRYYKGQVGFTSRNHFTSLDWNINNQQQGYLRDITPNFKDREQHSVAQTAQTTIDKAAWYQHLPITQIKLNHSNITEQKNRLAELQNQGAKFKPEQSTLPYIPLTALFDREGAPNSFLFAQIPHGAIIEIVRPNWNLRKEIGTDLDISHLGFVFWKNKVPVFRQASSQYQRVVDISLIHYLRTTLKSPTIKGINIQEVTYNFKNLVNATKIPQRT